jgi:deoxyribonuclease (pyrimidine dimer)
MTRINVVPVEELVREHLQGEYHEITRVFTLARAAQNSVLRGSKKLPLKFTLGTGHVLFFYNKLGWVADRYEQLTNEMRKRGYKVNPIPREKLLEGIDSRMQHSYNVTQEALRINRQRIAERLKEKEL